MTKKMSLIDIIKHFNKFNDMEFNSDCARKMAILLVEKFGFEDKKDYGNHFGVIQMFNWAEGDGTLFGYLEGWGYGKIEIGKRHDSSKGWFCPDFD
jgi:hypothetical protein